MSLQDPISDMFTRINNALNAGHVHVSMQDSKLKQNIARVLKAEGYINDFSAYEDEAGRAFLKVILKYHQGKKVIDYLKRISKPGLRIYKGLEGLPKVMGGLGCAIISTSQGVMTDREARKKGIGGEVLGIVA